MGPTYGVFVMNTNVIAAEGNGVPKFEFAANYIKMFGGDVDLIQN